MNLTQDIILYIANKHLNYTNALVASLNKQFGTVTVVSDAADYTAVFASSAKLVIVVGIETMPTRAKLAMQSYLENHGRVLLLGGPAFEKPYQWNGKPLSQRDYRARVIESIDDQEKTVILDTSTPDVLEKLSAASDNATEQVKAVGDHGLNGSKNQLFYHVENLFGWATLSGKIEARPDRANAISFHAKPGDDHTGVFTFVIQQSNGARFRTKMPFVSKDWFLYVFVPEDFVYFTGGVRAEHPDLSDIVGIQIAFETSYSKIAQGSHGCYISDITLSYVEDTAFGEGSLDDYNLNGVTPLYEQYPITNAAKISADTMQAFVADRDYVIPSGQNALVSRHAGICGIGYGKNTDIRFIPLLNATDEHGLVSGYIAWIDLYATATGANGPCEGSLVGYFGATTDEFYNADGIAAVTETAVAMMGDVFIVNGGTNEHTYVSAETSAITAGVQFVMFGSEANAVASVSLYEGARCLATYTTKDIATASLPNAIKALEATYDLGCGTPDRVVAELSVNGQPFDRLEHSIHYWSPKPQAERSFISTEDGYFKKDGKIINFFGVNYYPTYSASEPPSTEYRKLSSTYTSYISRDGYDPTVIMNDLKRIQSLGMNAIAVTCYADAVKASNNLLDLLRICEDMGIYVELSLARMAYPLRRYSRPDVEATVKKLHLDEIDTIISYDICWEERIGNYLGGGGGSGNGRFIGRAAWDGKFTEWAKVQYGSIEAAEAAWGVALDRTDAGYLLLTDAMMDDTSETYRKAVAAYYRFLDDIVSTSMEQHLSHLKACVPDQLVTFRMSMAGSTLRGGNFRPSVCCFDFQSLASGMSYMEPEGYQLNNNDETCLQVMFANAYARYAKPCAPVVWKEFGKSVWAYHADGNFYPSKEAINSASDYYRYVLDYCLKSRTAGIYCWWSIAGYRPNEDSDYGIFNPDGSDRGEITALLREYAPKFINRGECKGTVCITVERDDHVGGLFGMFEAVKDELADAYAAGKSVTFIDKSQSTDGSYAYADTLLDHYVADAVSTAGTAPLRYVNGIVKNVDITTEGEKTFARVTVCNTKQSVWRAGTVSLASTAESDVGLHHTFDTDVTYLEDVTFVAELIGSGKLDVRFEIGGVAFGPAFSATVE